MTDQGWEALPLAIIWSTGSQLLYKRWIRGITLKLWHNNLTFCCVGLGSDTWEGVAKFTVWQFPHQANQKSSYQTNTEPCLKLETNALRTMEHINFMYIWTGIRQRFQFWQKPWSIMWKGRAYLNWFAFHVWWHKRF